MSKEIILVVDDEQNIIELARLYLEQDGYRVEQANTGLQALAKIKQVDPALMILDLMLPELDGWEVCRRVRAGGEVPSRDLPIIMLTARDEDVDKIVGLELGADDYLTKPFNPRELVARVKAILRRSDRAAAPTKTIRIGDLTIDPARREALVAGQPIELRAKEFDCLLTLAENKGIVLSREKLLELAWGYDFAGQTRTVDVHVAHLRKKIAHSTAQIETVTSVGYKLVG
ncbi:MAG TPA: response regulator transcription factor [Anaerolineae bacterium]|nr:response regulator transcription factor [Anaerolineae bacterium]